MNKVETTNKIVGLKCIQVCCEADATDSEILEHCNKSTSSTWLVVVNKENETLNHSKGMCPVNCKDYAGRLHKLVVR